VLAEESFMLFNSLAFAIFFPLVTILYFILPHRYRWCHLLAASCLFYMFFIPLYILILLFTIVIDYLAGILIERSDGKVRRTYLMLSLIANIGVLAVFKYYNFAAASITEIANWLSWVLHRRCSTAFFRSA
jgi:alginate O-acetyltransferase complex protein AlgI